MVNIREAKTRFSRPVERAERGEEIVIARAGTPVARLVAYRESRAPRVPGGWEGRVWIAPDFDGLSPELAAAFRGELS
ncbi:MAG TPA: type II toxin-antitoxin system prevent-host-death family antitoxin [Candidatus Dormibacteraeota bacterium]|nr:type II toxin-antitoxin system prevent-host-death family antitoxin [Candidatus Dormibacteraeota bacterium]